MSERERQCEKEREEVVERGKREVQRVREEWEGRLEGMRG